MTAAISAQNCQRWSGSQPGRREVFLVSYIFSSNEVLRKVTCRTLMAKWKRGEGAVRELQPYPPSDTPTSLYQLLQGCYQPSSHLLFFPALLLRFPSLPFLSFSVRKSRLGTDAGDEEGKRDVEGDVLNYFPNKIGRDSGHCFRCAIVFLCWGMLSFLCTAISQSGPREMSPCLRDFFCMSFWDAW